MPQVVITEVHDVGIETDPIDSSLGNGQERV